MVNIVEYVRKILKGKLGDLNLGKATRLWLRSQYLIKLK